MPPKEENKAEGSPVQVIRSGMFGQIEQYVLGEDWDEYMNRLEMFFQVNDTPDEMKVPVMFTVAGPSLYTLANRLCAPVSPRIKTYTELTALFKDHLGPTTNVVSERYQLRFCEQTPSQRRKPASTVISCRMPCAISSSPGSTTKVCARSC